LNSDAGCVAASVQNAGTGQTLVTTNTGVYMRSDKVIKLTPAIPIPGASYQLTLYYTTAELATWGANVPNLRILKVNDGVSLNTTLTPLNASVFYTVVVDDQRATKGYASFTVNVVCCVLGGGLSQFM